MALLRTEFTHCCGASTVYYFPNGGDLPASDAAKATVKKELIEACDNTRRSGRGMIVFILNQPQMESFNDTVLSVPGCKRNRKSYNPNHKDSTIYVYTIVLAKVGEVPPEWEDGDDDD